MKKLIFILLLAILSSCHYHYENDPKWEFVYKNDKKGNIVSGSKQRLINAIRQGAAIRVAWGFKGKTRTIEHVSEPIWIAVLDGKEVIAHLDPQVLSLINWDDLKADYSDPTKLNEEWRVVINTNGEFDAIWYDKAENKLIKRMPQNHPISWFVQGVNTDSTAVALYKE